MSTPPRRRRPFDQRRSPAGGGGGWVPTIAMGLGVILAGLGIGALVAVFMQRNVNKPTPVAIVSSAPAPAPAPARAPIAIPTSASQRTPRPLPSPSPTVEESAEASAEPTTPAASPTAAPSAAPSVVPTRVAVSRNVVRPSTERPGTSPPVPAPAAVRSTATPEPSAAPAPAQTSVSAAAASALPSPPEPPTSTAPSAYDEHASAIVRRYIEAVVRGDDKTALDILGGTGTLSEQAFLDPAARIVSLKVTRIDASNASVGAEISTAKGHYYATYHVTAASSGPYISEHDYIKV